MIGKAIHTTGNQKRSIKEEIPEKPHIGASESKVKVLYIAGWGRSGSTILGRILGQLQDFFMAGELRHIWDRGVLENWLCSCGTTFDECSVWREVISQVLDGDGSIRAEELVDLRDRGLRSRHFLLTPTHKLLQKKVAGMEEYVNTLERLYEVVQDVTRCRVIIDTSKYPSYGYALQSTRGIDLYVLHLVRDPRAVAYSWESKKKLRLHRKSEPNVLMVPHSSTKSSLVWNEWNFAIEMHIRRRAPERYMLMRYEDFVNSPLRCVKDTLRFLGEETTELPFEDERTIPLGLSHTFSGNPDRFRSGTVAIKPDEGWTRNMGVARQAMVTTLTWPGLVRYRYPLLPHREP